MPMETLRTQVMAANRHERGLKMQPSLAVEADWFAAIQKDVTKLLQERETSDVMQKDHPTNWPFGRAATPYNLFNKSGVTSQYKHRPQRCDGGLHVCCTPIRIVKAVLRAL